MNDFDRIRRWALRLRDFVAACLALLGIASAVYALTDGVVREVAGVALLIIGLALFVTHVFVFCFMQFAIRRRSP